MTPGERLDSFPYRHRLGELMSRPPESAPASLDLASAAARMSASGISSLLVEDGEGGIKGIVTERDILRAVARAPDAVAGRTLGEIMSHPLVSLPESAFVYRAIGRMDRLGIRHLGVTDATGRVSGVITARGLLRQRSAGLLALGDEIDAAEDVDGLRRPHDALPGLARLLLDEGVPALEIAGVISGVLCDLTERAGIIAAREVSAARGPAPSPWCLLVLGSGGRGESLLAADQDNALVHGGGEDGWFAALGARIAALLDGAGVPYCKGGIMAANAPWRGSLDEWAGRIDGWIGSGSGAGLLNVDIFYDFRAVHGDRDLARELRELALARAAGSPGFLALLASAMDSLNPPLGFLGRIRTEGGRVDLKKGGLLMLTGAARVMALRHRVGETSTAGRLRAIAGPARLALEDVERMERAQALFTRLILDQQLADLAAGIAPSTRVETRGLSPLTRRELKEALEEMGRLRLLVRDALTA
ncbi:MAG: CBS domain-containing protein [Alphaproteobacteria bacterium]|nr:CBS domain-containing protein [Alphaproteobacteria bacterium]